MKERDYAIEAYRVFCMFGICFLHASGHVCGHPTQWLANLFYWCVPGFVLITGWFGLRLSVKKIIKLYGMAIYAVIVIQLVRLCFGHPIDWVSAVKMFRSFWFLNAYVILMLMSPALNFLLSNKDKTLIFPILFIAFGWSFLRSVRYVQSFIPVSPGVEPFSCFMMMGVYIIGRWIRDNGWIEKINLRLMVTMGVVSIPLVAIGLCSYASPFSVALAILGFIIFKRGNWAGIVGRWCIWVVPSLFSIYLFHSRGAFGLALMGSAEGWLLDRNVPLILVYLVAATAAFVGGCVLDAPRRVFLALNKCWINNKSKSLMSRRTKT